MNEFELVALPIVFSEGDQASKPWEKDDLRDGNLLLMLSFHEMLKSSSFKQKLVKGPFIDMLTTIIDACESVTSP